MSKCRKCENFIKEDDYEYYVVHQWETHGYRISESQMPNINWELVKELKLRHRTTGQAGSEDVFGKKSTKKLI